MADETLEVLIRMRGGRAAAAEVKGLTGQTTALTAATDRQGAAATRASASGGRLRSMWGGMIGVGARLGATLGAAGIGGAAFFAVKAFSEKQRAVAQTSAVLKSTGGQANVTERQIDRLSTRVARMAGVDDEVVRAGQNMLLTFRDVRNEQGKGNDIFNQGVLAAADLSSAYTAMGKNMSVADASLQIGKALNDPAKGMARLQRIGVTFTDQQKKQAEQLMKTGDRMGAQKIILAELSAEFGGSAAKQGKTLAGTWGRVRFEAGEVAEAVGNLMAPALAKLGAWTAKLFNKMQPMVPLLAKAWKTGGPRGFVQELDRLTGAGGKLVLVFDIIAKAIRVVGDVIGWVRRNANWLVPVLATLLAGFLAYRTVVGVINMVRSAQLLLNAAMLLNPIGLVVAGIAMLVAGFVLLYTRVGWFRRAVQAVWGWLKSNWPLLLAILTGPIGVAVLLIVKHWDKIKAAATGLYNWVKGKLGAMVGFIAGLPGKIASAASGAFDGLKEAFRSAVNFIIRGWNSLRFHLPGFDPPGPGPKFGGADIGVPRIPLLAEGGDITRRGAAIVGDLGPELLELPEGARVSPLEGGGRVREVVRIVTVRGRVLAEAVFDEAETAKARA